MPIIMMRLITGFTGSIALYFHIPWIFPAILVIAVILLGMCRMFVMFCALGTRR